MRQTKITGTGHYVPQKVVTNIDLEQLMNTSDAWIKERTGISERRYFDPEKDTVGSMAANAARMALNNAGKDAKDIDFIILATITPDYYFPGSGVLLQRELGLEGIGALDIRNACSGFVYALSIADQFIKTGMYKTILVAGAEIQSSGLDFSDSGRAMSVIFADGAGAVLLEATDEKNKGILSTHLHSDGKFAEELFGRDPGSSRKNRFDKEIFEKGTVYPYMNGNAVFKHAVSRFYEVIMEALNTNNNSIDDLSLLIPHQANLRISKFIQDQLKLPDNKVYNNIMRYGNTTAASIPIALSEAFLENRIKDNDLVCLAAFGSGFSWASALIRW